jgi:surface carbohydrate biosynthesis protein
MNSFPRKKWLTMPVEVAARELDAKILLGLAAARAGYNVIVGSIRAISGALPALPRGVWVTGCIDRSKVADLRLLRQYGYRIVCSDEEGFMQFNDSHYARNRLSEEGMAEIDYMMASSPDHVRIVTDALPGARHKVVQTGNPRTDLLRPEFRAIFGQRAEERRRRFGRFILVNTNFSENALVGQEMLRHMRTITGGIVDEHDRAWYAARHAYETAILEEFAEMFRHLGREMADIPVILRPHPQEDFGRWRRLMKDYPNITVLYEDSVQSWALAAAAVVHNSCTTGVESHLLGRPVITYRPIRSEVYDIWLPNAVSEEITEPGALVQRLRRAVAEADRPASPFEYRHREALEQHFGPLEGPFAFERILELIGTLDVEPECFPSSSFPSPLFKEDVREVIRLVAQQVPKLSRRVFSDTHLDYWLFDRQKFPTMSCDAMATRTAQFQQVNPAMAGVDVRQPARNLFVLTAAN